MKDNCTMSPEYIGDFYVGDICKKHDKAYWIGGNKKNREEADVEFLKRLKKRTNNNWLSYIYYAFARLFGGLFYGWK